MIPHVKDIFGNELLLRKKIIFLNDENLKVLKGYKAIIGYNNYGEIIIRITGFAYPLIVIDKLKELPKEEVNGI